MSAEHDVIVVGGGPSGLMAAITASQGTPFWSARPDRLGRVLVLEEHKRPGGIAAYGTLSITNRWVVKGGSLKVMLLEQARGLPIEIRCETAATGLRVEGDRLAVDTAAGTHRAKAVVLACGIFSQIGYLRYRNAFFLAETLPGQRSFLDQAERAFEGALDHSRRLLIVGSHPAVEATAGRFRTFARRLEPEAILDSRHDDSSGALDRRLGAESASRDPELLRLTKEIAASPWNAGHAGVRTDVAAIVFDYNTYKLCPQNALRAVRGSDVRLQDGYVAVDAWGRTSVPGVWACGNAAFPLSGILQALYTGFVAGLSARSATDLAAFDEANGFLPWLAVPNSAWSGWLETARNELS
jgi:thioredoxin reductase